jgi:gentisate 1,2-dioxygenase
MIAKDSLDELFQDARRRDLDPAWTVYAQIVSNQPRPKAVPHVWRYDEARPLLERAGALVGTDDAERRVLMLTNPALKAPFTTDTLYAGLQLILPGEVARAHRHTAFALRFIIEGSDAFTAVGGEKVVMNPGDLVLTPSFEYHDHGNEGKGPMVWMDGLDITLYQWIPANFANGYEESRYPSNAAQGPSRLLYPWQEMKAELDRASGAFAEAAYHLRESGGPISATIGASGARIAPNASGPARRETASVIYHVVAGYGKTKVGDQTLTWGPCDTFAIPAWHEYRHVNDHDAPAYLFRIDDRPLLTAIGAYRRE